MNSEILKGVWAKVDGQFVAEVRCGGRGEEMVGRQVALLSKSKQWTTVKICCVVKDWGKGDVVHFGVVR